MAEQPTPTPSRGKGNFTTGRPASVGNAGNESPERVRNLPLTDADRTTDDIGKPTVQAALDQYNAEATYNEYSNHKASGHLNEIHQALGMLHESTGDRAAAVLQSDVGALADLRDKHGFTLHEDIIGGVKDIGQRLATMDTSAIPEHAKVHHAAALEAASNFVRTAEPAYLPSSSGYMGTRGKYPGHESVKVEPDYRGNIFDYAGSQEKDLGTKQWLKEMKQTADGKFALQAQGRKPNYEASRSPEQIAAKAAARKARNEARKAAKGDLK